MPIYAYRCSTCGHAKDVLQKMSDPLLTVCPECGASTFVKQVTAAGFQLKGSGWYVTDFRGGNNAKPKAEGDDKSADAGDGKAADGKGAEGKSADKGDSAPASADASKPGTAEGNKGGGDKGGGDKASSTSSEAKPAATPKPSAPAAKPAASTGGTS